MRKHILAGGLIAALALIGAGCDNCCRRAVPVRSNQPCCPPAGALITPPPPPGVSAFQPTTYRR